jgi:HlyD family secretion protein
MSAIPSVQPASLRTPGPVAPAAQPPAAKKPSSLRLWVLLALIAGGAWAGYQFVAKPKQQSRPTQTASVRTTKVISGAIKRVLRLTGSTSAKNFAMVSAPMMRGPDGNRALILINVASSGGIVKKGQVVAEIDAQGMKDHVDDISTQIQQAEGDVKKRKAEQALAWEGLQQNIRVTQAALAKSKLDVSAAEVRTVIDAELLKLSVEEQEATLKEQMADLAYQKISNAAEIRILEITTDRHVRHRDRHTHDIERFTIQAPINGLVVMQSIWRGSEMGQIQQGDQIAPGQPFMQIVDTSGMQVQSTASQVESDEMRLGQRAVVSFDAFPDLKLNAKVSSIGAIATSVRGVNYFLRTVPVYLSILDHDSRVIPDLSTASNVVVDQNDSALLVPREAVESKDGKSFVRVKTGDQFVPREVTLGVSDNLNIAVLSGVRAGEEIALDRPAAGPLLASN